MAVFRAVENRRSMVRSTASGQTCAVDPSGRVIALAPPFTEAWITAEVPVLGDTTLYTKYGDYLGRFFAVFSIALLIFGVISRILSKIKNDFAANGKAGRS
jgi:apolipoprotein N-acyltransferase